MKSFKIASIAVVAMMLSYQGNAQNKVKPNSASVPTKMQGKMVSKPSTPSKGVITKKATITSSTSKDQKIDWNSTALMPVFKDIKVGKLSNGLTYFIRKNGYPSNRVSMQVAVKVGSVMEDNDQLGLAHFTEHMAFNGTKNFKKSELVDYLEKSGMKFGADLNAYTSFDETVYQLELPTDKQDFITKGLTILMDWSHNVSFENSEIDKERGVVIEEWRLGKGANDRMFKKTFPVLYYQSKYADRLPIGTKESLDNFKYDVVKRFYSDWYRPDLQALIITGDIDVAKIEMEVKKLFSSIPAASPNARKREVVPVPSYTGTKYVVASDKEAQYNVIQMVFKMPKNNLEGTYKGYKEGTLDRLAAAAFQERLSAISKEPTAPILFAGAGKGDYMGDKDAFTVYAVAKPGKVLDATTVVASEIKKLTEFGVSKSEFERAKTATLASLQNGVNEKNNVESKDYSAELVRHFLSKESVSGIENELKYAKEILPTLTIEMANQDFKNWIHKDDNSVSAMLTEKEGESVITDQQLEQAFNLGLNAQATANKEENIPTVLMVSKPSPGTIISEKMIGNDITEWVLSNGARILFKPTKYKDDQLLFQAWSKGGQSLEDASNDVYTKTAADLVNNSGLADFSSNVLEKMMSDKACNVIPDITTYGESFNGSTNMKDMEWMFQMLNLYITKPRIDNNGVALMKSQLNTYFAQKTASPEGWFYDSVSKIMANNNARVMEMKPNQVDMINGEKSMEIYKRRMQNVGDFTFLFVGNADKDKLKSLVAMYLGSIPSMGSKESFKSMNESKPKGEIKWTGKRGTEPKSMVSMSWHNEIPYPGMKERIELDATIRVLSIMLRENLREEQGGVYGVRANQSIAREPISSYNIGVGFGCAPENKDKLMQAVKDEIKKLSEAGPSQVNLDKIKETLRRERETNSKKNEFWMAIIRQTQDYKNETLDERINGFEGIVNGLNANIIKETAAKYFKTPNMDEFVLMPEK